MACHLNLARKKTFYLSILKLQEGKKTQNLIEFTSTTDIIQKVSEDKKKKCVFFSI